MLFCTVSILIYVLPQKDPVKDPKYVNNAHVKSLMHWLSSYMNYIQICKSEKHLNLHKHHSVQRKTVKYQNEKNTHKHIFWSQI